MWACEDCGEEFDRYTKEGDDAMWEHIGTVDRATGHDGYSEASPVN